MKNIDLEELPKSKPFMNHVRLADKLTKETGLEHSFTFCRRDDTIVIDKICAGTECSAKLHTEMCGENAETFHTHPTDSEDKTRFSPGDIYSASRKSYLSTSPYIHCAKSSADDNVLCQKIVTVPKWNSMMKILALSDLMKDIEFDEDVNEDAYYAVQRIALTSMNKLNEHKHILFSSKTGKIIQKTEKGQQLTKHD